MKIFLITGISGSGKTVFVKALEDLGFFCVDNLPVPLLDNFFSLIKKSKKYSKIAIVIDVREKFFLSQLENNINNISRKLGTDGLKIIFLDARDEVLIRRFSETRRKHPINSFDIQQSIDEERKLLKPLRDRADFIIDTSRFSNYDLRKKAELISEGFITKDRVQLKIISFGFKNGVPLEADNVFDVRFIPNPYYVPQLKDKLGTDLEVSEFIKKKKVTRQFIKMLKELLPFMIQHYDKEGKNFITIAFGCTGGRHRSVFFAEYFYDYLKKTYCNISVWHRDI